MGIHLPTPAARVITVYRTADTGAGETTTTSTRNTVVAIAAPPLHWAVHQAILALAGTMGLLSIQRWLHVGEM